MTSAKPSAKPSVKPSDPPPSAPASPQRGGWRRARSWLLQGALLAAIVVLAVRLFRGFDWESLGRQLLGAQASWLSLAAAAAVARYVVWAERWRLALVAAGIEVDRWRSLGPLWASAAVNSVTPTARVFGGLLRARYRKESVGARNFGHVYGTVLYDQIQHQVVVGLASVLAAILVGARAGYGGVVLGASGLLALAGLGTWWWWRRSRGGPSPGGGTSGIERLLSRLAERAVARASSDARRSALLERGRDAVATLRQLVLDRGLAIRALLLGLAFFLLNAAAQWWTFRALGVEVSYLLVAVVVALGTFAGVAAGTPGGIGAAEAAMIAAFVGLQVDRVDATAGTFLFRGLHYLVTFCVGLPLLAALEIRHRRARR